MSSPPFAPTEIPNTLRAIRQKIRAMTARTSPNQISDDKIDDYINTFYVYDFPEHIRLESLRINYQFITESNRPVYDFPRNLYLTTMPPVYVAGYQSYMTQSRENFFRINSQLNFIQQSVATGDGTNAFSGTLINTPIVPGFKRNPPGAYSTTVFPEPRFINWNVLISANGPPDPVSGIQPSYSLVDDGLGNFFSILDGDSDPANSRGSINYITGEVSISNFPVSVPMGTAINAQYIPYVASRPQSAIFFQDQIILFPVPDQAYTVSFEAYAYPTAFLNDPSGVSHPQLDEWWQLLAFGASLKIFEDNGDFENYSKFRPLFEEQLLLAQRRTIVQQTSERVATIYSENVSPFPFPFGGPYSGFQ